ncbi:ClpXP adapter SpxH family protein [Domibacillus epiphyticus]|uniref:ClpXP adapter protein SpxH n=1 Tax=Domibacillus epiphyticus TaxID=1714355 RepID=A0A1V2A7W3_9BACI|nr:ClpXP adapter SpxH family protein [Domibacillus epiphyticus]OMP67091.1 dithiol-disulfide isomerase [Domibacillus epiphyticus]
MNVTQLPERICSARQKPLELYVFVDPLCPDCWALDPMIRKLQIEYGHYFKLRQVLTGKLTALNVSRRPLAIERSGLAWDDSIWLEDSVSSPFLASIAIKAAELQGKRAGSKFLRKLQEQLFLDKENVSDLTVLSRCAEEAGLDKGEFLNDIHSAGATKAFQCDLTITCEMDVDEAPTIVFFNERIEDEGIKISGLYSYDIYVQILQEMLEEIPEPLDPPPLEEFMQYFRIAATTEISEVYDWSEICAEREMKKLQLQQKVRKIDTKHGAFWEYVH